MGERRVSVANYRLPLAPIALLAIFFGWPINSVDAAITLICTKQKVSVCFDECIETKPSPPFTEIHTIDVVHQSFDGRFNNTTLVQSGGPCKYETDLGEVSYVLKSVCDWMDEEDASIIKNVSTVMLSVNRYTGELSEKWMVENQSTHAKMTRFTDFKCENVTGQTPKF